MTVNRKLKCVNPDCPHEKLFYFSDWVRENLPDSKTGFMVSDIDFVFVDRQSKKILLLEVKTNGKPVPTWQRQMFEVFHKAMRLCMPKGWQYLQYNLLVFEKDSFKNGKVYLNNKEITEQDLINFLSLKNGKHARL